MKVIVADRNQRARRGAVEEARDQHLVTTKRNHRPRSWRMPTRLIVRSATRVTPELLDKAPKLRAVGRAGVGVGQHDLAEATKRGVLVK